MKDLASRLAALELSIPRSSGGLGSDLRVIEMQISRAEEKVLRLGRAACHTAALAVELTAEVEPQGRVTASYRLPDSAFNRTGA